MDIVLFRPENMDNVGSIARCMKNFGFPNLVIVGEVDIEECRKTAKHAFSILKNAKMFPEFPSERYGTVYGTTGDKAMEFISPEEIVPSDDSCIIFGPEGTGMTKEELGNCDKVVRIPTTDEYPVMNLSHAVAVLVYEASKKIRI